MTIEAKKVDGKTGFGLKGLLRNEMSIFGLKSPLQKKFGTGCRHKCDVKPIVPMRKRLPD